MTRHYALVPAAGSGARFGAELPKQYQPLAGRPMIHHALQALCRCERIERVWVILSPGDERWAIYDWSALGGKVEVLRCGGTTRAASVSNGLEAVRARVSETQRVAATEPRDGLWQAQTPQMFRYGLLRQALGGRQAVTDEASAIEAMGLQPLLVRADATNFKVTYPADLELAELLLAARKR